MAKTAAADEVTIEIHTHTPKPKDIPYAAHIAALAGAIGDDPDAATTVRVPNGEQNSKGEYMGLAKHKRYIQDAAKQAGYSAKILSEEDYGDGTTAVEFGLREKIVRARKPRDAASSVDGADTPESVAA